MRRRFIRFHIGWLTWYDRQVLPKKTAKRALSMMMRGQAEEELEEEEEEELDEDSQDAAICT